MYGPGFVRGRKSEDIYDRELEQYHVRIPEQLGVITTLPAADHLFGAQAEE